MVNLPRSLRVVYELVLPVNFAELNEDTSSVNNNMPLKWQVTVHTYITIPDTGESEHLHSLNIPVNCLERHYQDMAQITQDIQSATFYVDPYTKELFRIGGDWIKSQLENAANH